MRDTMTNRECENRIRTAMTHAAPDRLESILSSCTEQSDPVVDVLHSQEERSTKMMKKQKEKVFIAVFAAAAALMLCISGFSLFGQRGGQVDSIILLDVNPSISLSVDEGEKVLAADALNEDAKEILGSMDLKGTSLEVAVNALIGSMLQKGYLGDLQNSILVSVENKDAARGEELKQKVSAQIAEALRTDSMDGAVLSQTVNAEDTELEALAQEYGISIGKASLIQEVIGQDSSLTFDALAPMTINEIALIASSRNVTQGQGTITQSGSASAQAYIGVEEALAKACAHAGVSVNDIYDREVEFDSERGVMTYEVDFKAGTVEYEYDIDAVTGEVIRFTKEDEGTAGGHHDDHHGDPGTAGNSGSGNTGSAGGSGNAGSYIGEDAAFAAALAHAGIADAQAVSGKKVELDSEDGVMVYDVDFMAGTMEYDYEIDAATGAVIWYDVENEGVTVNSSAGGGNTGSAGGSGNTGSYIGEDAAFAAALAHAGIADAQTVTREKVELDSEDGVMIYDVDFMVGTVEYDYEIEAATGTVLWYEVEDEGASGKRTGGNNAGSGSGSSNTGSAGSGNSGNAGSGSSAAAYIGEDAALSAALTHAGITDTSSVREVKKKLDREDGREIYEVEFKAGGREYEYEIDAYTGQILKADIEADD